MVQCPDAHLFCTDCVNAHAGNAVGNRQRVMLPALTEWFPLLIMIHAGHSVYGHFGLQNVIPTE